MIQSKKMLIAFYAVLLLLVLTVFLFRVSLFGKEGEAVIDESSVDNGQLELRYHFVENDKVIRGVAGFGIGSGQWKGGTIRVYYLERNPENHLVGKRGCLPKILLFLLAAVGVLIGGATFSKPVLEALHKLAGKN